MTDTTGSDNDSDDKAELKPSETVGVVSGSVPPAGLGPSSVDGAAATKIVNASSVPVIADTSVMVELDTSGKVGGGISLRSLDDDEKSLPEIHQGRERYQVLKTLGEGGMGTVHLVADRDLKRQVAMKVIRPEAQKHTHRFLAGDGSLALRSEKAARGVDGRWFPWGWRFDASLCNMRESRKERPAPVAVEEYPRDVSVYGVRGLSGNVREWTASEEVQGTGDTRRVSCVSRGGFWVGTARYSRAASRDWYGPAYVGGDIGLRLARSLR